MKKFWISCLLALALVALSGLGFVPAPGWAESATEKESHEKPAGENGEDGKEKTSKEESGGEKTGSEKGDSKDSSYMHLQPIVLPVISDTGAEQLVTLLIDLQFKDAKTMDDARLQKPRVQAAILQALYGGLGDGTLRRGHLVDIPKIKASIAAALDQCLGPKVVDDVLIQAVAQRML